MMLQGVRGGSSVLVIFKYLNIHICTLIRFLETVAVRMNQTILAGSDFPTKEWLGLGTGGCLVLLLPGGSMWEHRNIPVPAISPLRTRGSGTSQGRVEKKEKSIRFSQVPSWYQCKSDYLGFYSSRIRPELNYFEVMLWKSCPQTGQS